jgi:hypothetical protein
MRDDRPLIRTRDDLLELIAHVLGLQLSYLSKDQALARFAAGVVPTPGRTGLTEWQRLGWHGAGLKGNTIRLAPTGHLGYVGYHPVCRAPRALTLNFIRQGRAKIMLARDHERS